jgi:hypothetical protein
MGAFIVVNLISYDVIQLLHTLVPFDAVLI